MGRWGVGWLDGQAVLIFRKWNILSLTAVSRLPREEVLVWSVWPEAVNVFISLRHFAAAASTVTSSWPRCVWITLLCWSCFVLVCALLHFKLYHCIAVLFLHLTHQLSTVHPTSFTACITVQFLSSLQVANHLLLDSLFPSFQNCWFEELIPESSVKTWSDFLWVGKEWRSCQIICFNFLPVTFTVHCLCFFVYYFV